MLRLNCEITIGTFTFNYTHEIEVESSWETFTDTAKIQIPFKFKRGDDTLTATEAGLFKRGDEVTIKTGYYPDLNTVFEGYVSRIIPDSPFIVECEDAAWLAKQHTITKSYKKVSLDDLLWDNEPLEIEHDAIDANLGSFKMKNVNLIQVLDELKKTYGLVSFFRNGVLKSGLAYYPDDANDLTFDFEKTIIENSLEFLKEEDVRIKVKAISMLPDNKKIEVEVGDENGEQRTLTYYNLTEAELTEIAERELPKLKYTGYKGDFTTFGQPMTKHGDNVTIVSRKFPEREGTYLVDKVVTTFGVNGYRQNITLGPKVL